MSRAPLPRKAIRASSFLPSRKILLISHQISSPPPCLAAADQPHSTSHTHSIQFLGSSFSKRGNTFLLPLPIDFCSLRSSDSHTIVHDVLFVSCGPSLKNSSFIPALPFPSLPFSLSPSPESPARLAATRNNPCCDVNREVDQCARLCLHFEGNPPQVMVVRLGGGLSLSPSRLVGASFPLKAAASTGFRCTAIGL